MTLSIPPKTIETEQERPSLQALAREYRPTMPTDVLHLWAKDVVAAITPAPVAPQPLTYVTHDDFDFSDMPMDGAYNPFGGPL